MPSSSIRNAKVLLLQARYQDDPAKPEEVESFARRCGLPVENIISHDLLDGAPTMKTARQYDALMVGGSGDFYVSKGDLPSHGPLIEFLGELSQSGHPTFASCFGFQYLILALGGDVIHDAEKTELGTHEVTLSGAGQEDELFAHLPRQFLGQMGHKDRAADHVPGILTLASSALADVQAIRIPGQPLWATQFHPELDRETNLGRYWRYLDGYTAVMTDDEREAAVETFQDSPHTLDLLERFLRLVLS